MNRGGAETLIMNLYRNMDRSKVQFDFLTCKEGVFDKEIMQMGGNVHRIPYVTESGHRKYVRDLELFFKEHKEYKIVHSHLDKMSGFVLRSAKKANIPIRIAHSHNTMSEGGFLSRAYKWYAGNYVTSSATHLYACSQAAAKWLYKHHSEKATLLNNGIETDRFRFSANTRNIVRKELNIKQDTFVLGHVGRFAHQKNHDFLIDVFAGIHQKIPNSCLLLAGDGPLKQKIMGKVYQLKLEKKVYFLGVREDIHNLLQAFDMFVFPSLHEGLPVTLIEAQGAGLPCLISNEITQEVDMGLNLVQYLPLSDKYIWMKKMIDLGKKQPRREVYQEALSKKGYDIRKTAELTQNSYLDLGSEAV